jgi:hypothetical protein
MSLADFLFWILATYGATFGVKDAKLSKWPRDKLRKLKFFDELLSCTFCTGFWAAIVVSILQQLSLGGITVADIPGLLVKGLAGAASVYVLDLLVRFFEQLADGRLFDGAIDIDD